MATVAQAKQVMGLDDSKGVNDCEKRKRDESGSGAGEVIAKKRCFNQ